VGPAASVRALVLQAEAAGTRVYVVPPVDSNSALLDALAEQLGFPEWSGHNWDAAAELLSDLSWLPDGPLTLIWRTPEALADTDPAAHRMAVEVMGYAARCLRSRVLTVLLVHRGPH